VVIKMIKKTLIVGLVGIALFTFAPAFAANNVELQQLFEADQNMRRNPEITWDEIDELDKRHRIHVMSMLAQGMIKTGLDYFHAAVIFQHGESVADIRLAHSFASISASLGYERATWLQAASWDRLLMYFEQPQWYGTQFVMNDEGDWQLYEVDRNVVTDEQRAEWRVPSLAESEANIEKRNQ